MQTCFCDHPEITMNCCSFTRNKKRFIKITSKQDGEAGPDIYLAQDKIIFHIQYYDIHSTLNPCRSHNNIEPADQSFIQGHKVRRETLKLIFFIYESTKQKIEVRLYQIKIHIPITQFTSLLQGLAYICTFY